MELQTFHEYVEAFNARDYDRMISFYHPSVKLQLPRALLEGPESIRAYYLDLHGDVDESLRIDWFVSDEQRLAFECHTEFVARNDRPGFTFGALKRGESLRMTNFVHYDLIDEKFATIRVAHYRMH